MEPTLVEDCYRLLYKGNPKKMISQSNHPIDLWTSIQQKKLKYFDTKTVNLCPNHKFDKIDNFIVLDQ